MSVPTTASGSGTTRFGDATLAGLLAGPATGGVTLVEGAGVERRLSHDELGELARARLARWRAAGARAGDRVVLLVEGRGAFLECLHAAWLGALVPVPVAAGSSDEHRAKLFAVARALGGGSGGDGSSAGPWLACEPAALERLDAYAQGHGLEAALAALVARSLPVGDDVEGGTPHGADGATHGASDAGSEARAPAPGDGALIQFSSGSTGSPKGVVLTHRNLLANVDGILTGMAMRDDDVMSSWMPLTHDLGLIGFHLVPRLAGIEHVIMPTELFVRRPALWLERASAHRASVLCSPNFGYEHALKGLRPERLDALDLSAVRLVFNGAEPISAALATRFLDAYAPAGLARTAMFPVYGLAEASLAVTFPPVGAPLGTITVDRGSLGIGDPLVRADATGEGGGAPGSGAVTLVGTGRSIPHVEVRIADRDGRSLEAGRVGRILIRGPNVTTGYLVGDGALDTTAIDSEGWLDTGDLGALDGEASDAELFVTGRAKDIVFAAGRNLYPADLEGALVDAGVAPAGRVVVAAVPTADPGRDLLVAFVQHRAGPEAFEPVPPAVRAALASEVGVGCDLIVPVQRVPKTTSGKVQRFRLVEALLAGELDVDADELARALEGGGAARSGEAGAGTEDPDAGPGDDAAGDAAPTDRDAIEARLLALCRARIEGGAVTAGDNLFELGISSITLASIHADIDAAWPGALDITDLFDHPSVAEIADVLAARAGDGPPPG